MTIRPASPPATSANTPLATPAIAALAPARALPLADSRPSGHRRRFALATLASVAALSGLATLTTPLPASASDWPQRAIRVVVGFPPGGTTDIMSRVVAAPLQKALGQPVVVENKPGASGNVATSEVIRAAPALQDLMAGQIDFYFDPASGFSHIREGRANLLAVTGKQRSPFFPDTPTLAEIGVDGVELGNWFGVFAPAATPDAIVTRMREALVAAIADEGVKRRFADLGAEANALDGAAFQATLDSETQLLSALIKARNIVID